jgi:hypothetical protein
MCGTKMSPQKLIERHVIQLLPVGAFKISANPKESSNISQYADTIDQPNQIMLITAMYLDRYITSSFF